MLCFHRCVCPQGGSRSLSRGSPPQGVSVRGVSVQGRSLSRGVSVRGSLSGVGLCPGGGSLSWRPPYSNERAVRILLECILVLWSFLLVVWSFSFSLLLILGVNRSLQGPFTSSKNQRIPDFSLRAFEYFQSQKCYWNCQGYFKLSESEHKSKFFFLLSMSLINVKIKLDSLWTCREAMLLSR